MNGIDTIIEGNILMDLEDHRILMIKVMSFKFIKLKRSLWLSRYCFLKSSLGGISMQSANHDGRAHGNTTPLDT